jgi:predicted glycosyltransferase
LILSPDEMMVGGSNFSAAEAVILGVPALSKLLRAKLMVLNNVKMWKQVLNAQPDPRHVLCRVLVNS